MDSGGTLNDIAPVTPTRHKYSSKLDATLEETQVP